MKMRIHWLEGSYILWSHTIIQWKLCNSLGTSISFRGFNEQQTSRKPEDIKIFTDLTTEPKIIQSYKNKIRVTHIKKYNKIVHQTGF